MRCPVELIYVHSKFVFCPKRDMLTYNINIFFKNFKYKEKKCCIIAETEKQVRKAADKRHKQPIGSAGL